MRSKVDGIVQFRIERTSQSERVGARQQRNREPKPETFQATASASRGRPHPLTCMPEEMFNNIQPVYLRIYPDMSYWKVIGVARMLGHDLFEF